jgi:hypothetical protein
MGAWLRPFIGAALADGLEDCNVVSTPHGHLVAPGRAHAEFMGSLCPILGRDVANCVMPGTQFGAAHVEVQVDEDHLGIIWKTVKSGHKGVQVSDASLDIIRHQGARLALADHVDSGSGHTVRVDESMALASRPDGGEIDAVLGERRRRTLAFQIEADARRPDAPAILVGEET